MIRTDRIIASIPCASVMLCIVNRKLFIEIVWKRAIYVLIKNNTFVNFTLSVKRYPFQLSKRGTEGARWSLYKTIPAVGICNFKNL